VSQEAGLIDNYRTPEVSRTRACDHCGRPAIITRSMLSIYAGKTVRMFECSSCKQHTWSEE
jgi:hypothetical protein